MTAIIEPIGLSTSWSGPGGSPAIVLDQHRALGFRRVEAYMHFTPLQLQELAEEAAARGMQIASLHSPCPVPLNVRGQRERWTDGLASTDAHERTFAVDAIKRSIDAAVELGAHAIVVHLGNTGVPSRQMQIVDAVAHRAWQRRAPPLAG